MIQLQHVSKAYGDGTAHPHHALRDVDLAIEDGDVFGIIGQSGAGKSTLVRCINLLERPTEGRVIIDGDDVTDYAGKQLLDLRASIGMIFQSFSLFQQRTVLGNVTFPLELAGCRKAACEERARELLDLVGLADKADRYPSKLSGGQQQRVAIARALANSPRIMLCDEATGRRRSPRGAVTPGRRPSAPPYERRRSENGAAASRQAWRHVAPTIRRHPATHSSPSGIHLGRVHARLLRRRRQVIARVRNGRRGGGLRVAMGAARTRRREQRACSWPTALPRRAEAGKAASCAASAAAARQPPKPDSSIITDEDTTVGASAAARVIQRISR